MTTPTNGASTHPSNDAARSSADRYSARILRVLLYIQEHLDEAMSLAELADIAHISPYHFHRIFRGMVGEPVLGHVRRLRLERAAYDLTYTERGVSRIAFDAGYETHEAFTRAFKAAFGHSPSGWRKERRTEQPTAPSGVHYLTDRNELPFHPLTTEVPMDVQIVTREPARVAFIRHIGAYNEVGPVWERLSQWAGRNGHFGPTTQVFGLSYDDPDITEADKLRYDACLTVGDTVEGEGEVGVQEVPGGTYARFVHKGSYQGLATTYAAFFDKWLGSSDYEPDSRPAIESYMNDPRTTPEDELQTEIFISVTPKE